MARRAIRVELPLREFLYTLDQLALILNITQNTLATQYLYFEGVSTGTRVGRMSARDISLDPNRRDWRVAESSFRLFCTRRGWTVVEPRISG